MIDFSPQVIQNVLKRISNSTACGPDGISNFILRKVSLEICEPLSLLFSAIYEASSLPRQWKSATIIPIFKNKGSSSDCQNYRPISLTSCVCKLMELILHDHMYSFLAKGNLISADQFGFRPKFSTETQLLLSLNQWTDMIDRTGHQVDVIYLDFAKAFDSVSHSKLLLKLEKYGFKGKLFKFIEDFLRERNQRVKVGNVLSSSLPVTSGVPQGSVLGPLLFIIYVNDITEVLKYSSIKIYADDCKLYRLCRDTDDFIKLQRDLEEVQIWSNNWQMKLSVPKCQVLSLGVNPQKFSYKVNGIELERVSTIRDLGVVIASSLKPSAHCNKVAKAAHFKCAMIFRSFVLRDPSFLMDMFNKYVLSKLHYCSTVWNPWLKRDINCIERVLRRFSKRIPGLKDLKYAERLKFLKTKSLEYQRLFTDLVVVYKVLSGTTILCYDAFFDPSLSATRTCLLSKSCIHDFRKNFWSLRCVCIYNDLPAHVKKSESLAIFKVRLTSMDLSIYLKNNCF